MDENRVSNSIVVIPRPPAVDWITSQVEQCLIDLFNDTFGEIPTCSTKGLLAEMPIPNIYSAQEIVEELKISSIMVSRNRQDDGKCRVVGEGRLVSR